MVRNKYFLISFIFLSIYFCIFGLQKINLTATDTGRHVKNGELTLSYLIQGNWTESYKLLHTNYYSYTEDEFPFVNHHFGSGILAYIVYSAFGWNGLSIAFILCFLAALFVAYRHAQETSTLWIALPISIFLIPLIAERSEVRPEVISYFFITIFIYILSKYFREELQEKYLWILPACIFLWANLHIYFIFGIYIIGIFGFEAFIHRNWNRVQKLLVIGIASVLSACINPYGWYLLYYPFIIFKHYGYLVAENQSITFLEKINFYNPNFLWWNIVSILIVCTLLVTAIKKLKKIPIALSILTLTFAYLSFTAIRNLSIFGLISLFLLAELFGILLISLEQKTQQWMLWTWSIILSLCIISFSLFQFSSRLPTHANWGIGLIPHDMGSAEFVRATGIHGPIFNNYDIGGYLIFSIYPEKVFVDNRPETYPTDFFNSTYIPMQQYDAVWKQEDQKYNFNIIWFYRLDMTPWAQQFLINKVNDSEWVPVFVDDYTIIFVKNNTQNLEVIKKYALPKSMFGVK